MFNYANHEYSKEIIRELGRLLWDCLSDDEKEEFARISENENPVRDAYDDAMKYMENNDTKKVLNILDSFFNSYTFEFQDDSVNEYHAFSNPIEEALFDNYFKTTKTIRLIPHHHHHVEIYQLYGFLLIEFNRLDEAEKILNHAIKLNPVCTPLLFERSEIFKCKKDFESFYHMSLDALKYAYSTRDIARAYRNLGFYFIEKENYELATALFNYSLSFEFSPNAFSELEYIKKMGHKNTITEDEIKKLLTDKNIPLGVNSLIYNILSQLIMQESLNKNIDNQLYLYNIFYDLTHDEEVLDKINELKQMV